MPNFPSLKRGSLPEARPSFSSPRSESGNPRLGLRPRIGQTCTTAVRLIHPTKSSPSFSREPHYDTCRSFFRASLDRTSAVPIQKAWLRLCRQTAVSCETCTRIYHPPASRPAPPAARALFPCHLLLLPLPLTFKRPTLSTTIPSPAVIGRYTVCWPNIQFPLRSHL